MENSTDKTGYENLGKVGELGMLFTQRLVEQQFEGNDQNGLVRVCLQSSQIRDIQLIAKQPIAHDDLLTATKEAINDAIHKRYECFEEFERMLSESGVNKDGLTRLFNSDTES